MRGRHRHLHPHPHRKGRSAKATTKVRSGIYTMPQRDIDSPLTPFNPRPRRLTFCSDSLRRCRNIFHGIHASSCEHQRSMYSQSGSRGATFADSDILMRITKQPPRDYGWTPMVTKNGVKVPLQDTKRGKVLDTVSAYLGLPHVCMSKSLMACLHPTCSLLCFVQCLLTSSS